MSLYTTPKYMSIIFNYIVSTENENQIFFILRAHYILHCQSSRKAPQKLKLIRTFTCTKVIPSTVTTDGLLSSSTFLRVPRYSQIRRFCIEKGCCSFRKSGVQGILAIEFSAHSNRLFSLGQQLGRKSENEMQSDWRKNLTSKTSKFGSTASSKIKTNMSDTLGQVVIFKAPTDSDKEQKNVYEELLSNGGFDVINVPVLDFDFINLGSLSVKLNKPEDYSGIIFSSPRCVRACQLACEKHTNFQVLAGKWNTCKNYAVGESTAKTAEEVGFHVLGKEAGNANALADIIIKCNVEKPFLYPIGSLTNNNFKLKLKESNIEADDIIIYETKPYPNLEGIIIKLLEKLVQPVYFLYFSPSGVKFSLPILRGKNNFNEENVKFVAIGPTTEKAMKEHGLTVFRTVPKPTPEATLLALIS